MQLYYSFAVWVGGTSVFIVIKYTRLRIKNKFPHKKINFDQLFGPRNNTIYDYDGGKGR